MRSQFLLLRSSLETAVVGQHQLVNRLLVALLADGHLLVEGLPGLAKTRAVQRLAGLIDCDFHRVQFTPDLLPADLTGSEVFRPQDGSFHFEKGPIFHSLVLADEINRAPAKVQSALLEAMEERQVTVGQESYPLPALFMVMATQNPIEHEGTYALPEAQRDRFLLHVRVGYPEFDAERSVLHLARSEAIANLEKSPGEPKPILGHDQIHAARKAVFEVHLSDAVEDYILRLVSATRRPEAVDSELAGAVRFGASPRASIALDRCARAFAWLEGRDYATPDDVQQLAPDILRHRILLEWQAEADGMDADQLIDRLIARVPVP